MKEQHLEAVLTYAALVVRRYDTIVAAHRLGRGANVIGLIGGEVRALQRALEAARSADAVDPADGIVTGCPRATESLSSLTVTAEARAPEEG